ncbi:MAG: hypothetical protein ACR2HR_07140 [Euzebya sp.]
MSDGQTPYDPTTRLDAGGDAAYEPTTRMPQDDPPPADRTQRLPATPGATPQRSQPISYTEDYNADRAALDDRAGVPPDPMGPDEHPEDAPRTFTTTALILTSVAALLIGAILTLIFLPEQDPQVVLTDQSAAQALTEAQTANAQQATRISELEAMVAERDATIAGLQAAQEGNQAAADQAAADRQTALDQREAALNQRETDITGREQAVAQRETQVAEREQAADTADADTADADTPGDSGGGFELPNVPDLEIPADLPQIDEEAARGVLERFIDRIQSFFGS